MTLEEFSAALATALPGQVFETAAPDGQTEYAAWHEYGAQTLVGDDAVQLEAPRVQIDVIWQTDRTLLKRVKTVLTALALAYEVVELGYDDDWMSMRCILQLEVV